MQSERFALKFVRRTFRTASIAGALIEFTRKTFGRLDLLVNNAGVAPEVRADILEASEESFDRLIDINVKGPYFLTQLAASWMIEQVRKAVRHDVRSRKSSRSVPSAPTRHQ